MPIQAAADKLRREITRYFGLNRADVDAAAAAAAAEASDTASETATPEKKPDMKEAGVFKSKKSVERPI